MKLESLIIIFIIIIMPIVLALSNYIDNVIESKQTEMEYNTKLLNSTYDAIKAYQLNTVSNAFGDITNSKIDDIEASVNAFYNSLAGNFDYTGYKSNVMKEYVPAIVFTLYDGYYIYSPYINTLTEIPDTSVDTDFSEPGEITDGLKPYIYYSCRYQKTEGVPDSQFDFVITYTLDNYITIQGMIGTKYVYDCGYLYSISTTDSSGNSGIYYNSTENSYTYEGITFRSSDTEELKEYIGGQEYSYVKINGMKYYLDENYTAQNGDIDLGDNVKIKKSSGIFYIDTDGTRNYNQIKYNAAQGDNSATNQEFIKYCKAIKKNKSAYEYYKNAYEFSRAALAQPVSGYKDKSGEEIHTGYGLQNLQVKNAYIWSYPANEEISLKKYYGDAYENVYIFSNSNGNIKIENKQSNFNEHRGRIIRYVVETNLSAAIKGFSNRTGSSEDISFIMPKITDDDWDLIQNNVCTISFLQGMSIGTKKYSGYAVVPNSLTKEYIAEDSIYILTVENAGTENEIRTYSKTNDKNLRDTSTTIISKNELGYYPGVWKLNFQIKKYTDENTGSGNYYPMQYKKVNGTIAGYQGSYTSIMGTYKVEPINTQIYPDMYTYVKSITEKVELKKAYYVALGRERWGSYNVNNINYEIYGNNGNEYFLQSY